MSVVYVCRGGKVAPLVVISRVTLEGIIASTLFWHLVLGPVIGGQAYRVPPLTHKSMGGKNKFVRRKDWPSVAKCRTKRKSQMYKAICLKAVLAILRG